MKKDATDAFEQAQLEFFEGVPGFFDQKRLTPKEILDTMSIPADADSIDWNPVYEHIEYAEVDPSDFGVKEKIIALAFEASYSNDTEKLVEYLEEQNLYQKFEEVSQKYNLEQHAKNLRIHRKAIDPYFFTRLGVYENGDIFLKYDQSSSNSSGSNDAGSSGGSNLLNVLIPGKWGHAAFYDANKRAYSDNYFLLSASNQVEDGGIKVGHDKIIGYWADATETAVYRVSNASAAARQGAINYSLQFKGKPFSFFTSRTSNSEFYCSKLVYRGWLSQGYELEPHYSSITKLPWLPIIGVRWDSKKIGFFRIYYPVFVVVDYIKDIWITPTDLADDNDTYLFTSR